MASHVPDPAVAVDPLRDAPAGGPSDATKARLLAAAEALVAERGFEGMSIRALASRAGTSVSAAHYHFGSKLALVAALFEARIAPINAVRLARLEALVAEAAPAHPGLEAVIESFVRPGIEAWREQEALGRTDTPHILAQLHADRSPRLAELKRRLLEPVMDRYGLVVAGILPDRDPAQLRVGLAFVLGMLIHTVGGHLDATLRAAGRLEPRDDEAMLRQLVDFSAAGLRAESGTDRRPEGGASCVA